MEQSSSPLMELHAVERSRTEKSSHIVSGERESRKERNARKRKEKDSVTSRKDKRIIEQSNK